MSTQQIRDPANPAQTIAIGRVSIDPQFVEVLDLRLRYGRSPRENETGVALVNEALARSFFGRDNVVGESLEIRTEAGESAEIVGVLEDLSFVHPAADVDPIAFLSVAANSLSVRGVIESALTTAELQSVLQTLIDSGELDLGRPGVTPLRTLRRNLIAADTARSLLTIGTASLVVLLATIGFYGTQTYLVTAGRREYAIRAALGAGPRSLRRLVFLRGLGMGLPGLVAGGLLAFIVVAWLRDDYVSREISPGFVSVIVVTGLCLILCLASLGPSRRAMRTQPASLLRQD
jgi:ABC-type antimicrobial peptide transport system permease subunit